MAAKLDTPDGRALYKQRKAIIEPAFAQLFARFGRTLHYRGNMVDTEIHLWAAVTTPSKTSGPAPAANGGPPRQPHNGRHSRPAPAIPAAKPAKHQVAALNSRQTENRR